MSVQPFEIPADARPPVHPTVCDCSHRVYTHGRWKEPGSGAWIYSSCKIDGCSCEAYRAADGTDWPPS